MIYNNRWRCEECKKIFNESELLQAQNPFDIHQTISGCPNCKAVEDFINICDEPGCDREATCGFPTPSGYRRTCGDHMREYENKEKLFEL